MHTVHGETIVGTYPAKVPNIMEDANPHRNMRAMVS
jgi:hypothetical protein